MIRLSDAQQGILERSGLHEAPPFDEDDQALTDAWHPSEPGVLRLPDDRGAQDVLWRALIDQGNLADEKANLARRGEKADHRQDARSWYALATQVSAERSR